MVSIGRRNTILTIVLLVVIALAVWSQPDYERPNVEFLPAMRRSPSFEAYEPNPVLPGGTSSQTPIPGTIARGQLVLHYKATPEDAVRAGEELANPIPPKSKDRSASVGRGGRIFQTYCSPCHGGGGLADGPVVKRGYPPPPSLLTGKSVQMKDGQLFHILTYGQGNMAPFAGQLTPAERWDVINFIRSMQEQEKKRQQAAAAAAKKEAAKTKTEQSGEEASTEGDGAKEKKPEEKKSSPPNPAASDGTSEKKSPSQEDRS